MLLERLPQTVGYPMVGRFGLAHSMMAWARCVVWCRQKSLPMLAPSWTYPKIGPYLRGERDKRQYTKLFKFTGYYTGFNRAFILATYTRVDARESDGAINPTGRHQAVVFQNVDTFEGQSRLFQAEVLGHSIMLNKEITRVTRQRYLPPAVNKKHIAIHIRRGDFRTPATEAELQQGHRNSRIPIAWYRDMLIGIRSRCQIHLPAIVYSDGSDDELTEVLALPDVVRSTASAAITDLLAISQATLLLASGSGFSIWGSFLGQVPRICFPGQLLISTLEASEKKQLEAEGLRPSDIPDVIFNYLNAGGWRFDD